MAMNSVLIVCGQSFNNSCRLLYGYQWWICNNYTIVVILLKPWCQIRLDLQSNCFVHTQKMPCFSATCGPIWRYLHWKTVSWSLRDTGSQQCVSRSQNIWPHLLISKWADVGPVVQFLTDKPGWLIWSCVPLPSMSPPSTCADMRGGDANWAALLKRWARPYSKATSQKRLAFHTATNRMPFVSLC